MSQADAPAADWYPDPSGRFQFRYWDGEAWTGHVSTDGKTDWDPPGEAAPEDQQADPAQGEAAQGDAVQADASQSGATQSEVAPDEAAAPDGVAVGGADAEAGAPGRPDEEQSGGAAAEDTWAPEPGDQPSGGTIEEGEPSDANLVANRRADLEPDVEAWVDEVANQVEPRLSRINTEWTTQPQAEAARACAYGLLIGHLAHLHPHMRSELSQVAEAHPSFTTLEAGARLETLEQIARDHQRSAAWLGPLIGTEDAGRVAMLFD